MIVENKFNLVDEPWIPIANEGLVSLRDIFTKKFSALGGNPIQKISVMKLLLAIAQSAYTPVDDSDWQKLGAEGLSGKSLAYLNEHKESFWLYGEKPFLQMRSISSAKVQEFGAILPHVATGNTTVLIESQVERELSDAGKALLVLVTMSFALGGKKTDNSVVLSAGFKGKSNAKGKPSTGHPGPSIGFMGFLHSFLNGVTLRESIWLNLITKKELSELTQFPLGLGSPAWEEMPKGEVCDRAQELKGTYAGRLVPLSRFVLLTENGMHYSEGVSLLGYAEGAFDVSTSIDSKPKKPKALWAKPDKRPWRELSSLLSFLNNDKTGGWDCFQIKVGVDKANGCAEKIGLWVGGLSVSSNAGEQYASGSDDFIESEFLIETSWLGLNWYTQLVGEMSVLENISKMIYASVMGFFKSQNSEAKGQAAKASNLFWQLSETGFQDLLKSCDGDNTLGVRRRFVNFANQAYNQYCPKDTARQLDAWAANRPQLGKFLKKD